MSFNVLVTAPSIALAGLAVLEEAGCRVLYAGTPEEMKAVLAGGEIDAIISRILPISGAVMDLSPRLRVISRHGVGYNNVDVAAATARGIPVFITKATNAQSVVELTVGLLIAAARKIIDYDQLVQSGGWVRVAEGKQLSGLTLGLVGLGVIGRGVAGVARALGMRVLAFDPALPGLAPDGIEIVPTLEALLTQSDALSLHCPLTTQTKNLIGSAQLQAMRPRSILINTARGGLVDEAALTVALASGHIAAAALDSLAEEPPPPGYPLLNQPGLILTPHVGGSTEAAMEATAVAAARNVLASLNGKTVSEGVCVNPDVQTRK